MSAAIAFVGAGSVVFTKNLLGDILAYPELGERRDRAARHRRRPARDRGGDGGATSPASAAPRRRSARTSTGARRSTAPTTSSTWCRSAATRRRSSTSRCRPASGLRQTIADTLGIGGIFRTLRTADHMLALGREMADLCPGAWLLNYTNPMAMLCWLVYAGTPTAKVVGLCHSVQYTVGDSRELVGVPAEEVTFLAAGLNHQAFILRFERDGETSTRASTRAIAARPGARSGASASPLYRRLGFFPTESSEHAGRVRAVVHAPRRRARALPHPGRRVHPPQRGEPREFERVKDALARGEPMPVVRSNEYAATIIHCDGDRRARVIYGNVRNAGLLPGLPGRLLRRGAVPRRRHRPPPGRGARLPAARSPP